MKRFEELSDADNKDAQDLIENIFTSFIKNKSNLNSWFQISNNEANVLLKKIYFVEEYCKTYGYIFHIKVGVNSRMVMFEKAL